MPHNGILIPISIIGTILILSGHQTTCIILIHIRLTVIAGILLIIYIIRTQLTMDRFHFCHSIPHICFCTHSYNLSVYGCSCFHVPIIISTYALSTHVIFFLSRTPNVSPLCVSTLALSHKMQGICTVFPDES